METITRYENEFAYFNTQNGGVVTIAFNAERKNSQKGDTDEIEVVASMSFCAPQDMFCKSKGRMIAKNRLTADTDRAVKYQFTFDAEKDAPLTVAVMPKLKSLLDTVGGGAPRTRREMKIPRWFPSDPERIKYRNRPARARSTN